MFVPCLTLTDNFLCTCEHYIFTPSGSAAPLPLDLRHGGTWKFTISSSSEWQLLDEAGNVAARNASQQARLPLRQWRPHLLLSTTASYHEMSLPVLRALIRERNLQLPNMKVGELQCGKLISQNPVRCCCARCSRHCTSHTSVIWLLCIELYPCLARSCVCKPWWLPMLIWSLGVCFLYKCGQWD